MKKTNILKCLSALLLITGGLTLASCGEESNVTSNPQTSSKADDGNKIKSITAVEEVVTTKVGKSINLKNYYKVNPVSGKSLSSTDAKVTFTLSSSTVAKLSASSLKAIAPGECTITVTSKIDETKFCSFKVVVKDVYFDAGFSKVDTRDDLEKELIADGGTIRTLSKTSGEVVVKDINATKWYAETSFVVNSVDETEKWPKIGIFTTTAGNSSIANQVYFFLNAVVGDAGNSTWNDFGVCEVENSENWAWNSGVTNTTARHVDNAYTNPDSITFGTKVKMGVLREGLYFHVYVNDNYKFTIRTLETLFNGEDNQPISSRVGFFQFNSDVTFSDYGNTTADETVVNEKLAALPDEKIVPEWAED